MGRDTLKDRLVEKYKKAYKDWLELDVTPASFDDFFSEFEMYFEEYFPLGN